MCDMYMAYSQSREDDFYSSRTSIGSYPGGGYLLDITELSMGLISQKVSHCFRIRGR